MHRHGTKEAVSVRHLSHVNFLFSGRGSHIYERTMVPLTRNLYQRVVEDMVPLQLIEGMVLDAGTGPGTLVRAIAHRFPQLQVHGVDLSEGMIQLAREHAQRERLEERAHYKVGDVRQLPYPDQSFAIVVSTISLHHWQELEQPLRELYRVLQPGGRLWIYDARFITTMMIKKAQASTPFAHVLLEDQLVRTGFWPFAIYRRFSLQKPV